MKQTAMVLTNGWVTLTPTGLNNGELVKFSVARDHDDGNDD
jgi:hypothetical protein